MGYVKNYYHDQICAVKQEDGPTEYDMPHHYRGYTIAYDPPPIGVRDCDWQFSHKDYDGAPDSGDVRSGAACSLNQAKDCIDDIYNVLDEEETDETAASSQFGMGA